MTEEELRRRSIAVKREFPETEAAFDRIRSAMVSKLFLTPMGATDQREKLYYAVQTLDAVKAAMIEMMGVGSDDIEKYIEQIAATAAQ